MTSSSTSCKNNQRLTPNDTWPKLISVAKVGECYKVKAERSANKHKREIDVRLLSPDDLKSIKEQDPFMYYSLPEARRAMGFDTSNVGVCPSLSDSSKVTRRTCISYECHPDLLFLDDLLNAEGDCDVENCEGLYDLESFMASCAK